MAPLNIGMFFHPDYSSNTEILPRDTGSAAQSTSFNSTVVFIHVGIAVLVYVLGFLLANLVRRIYKCLRSRRHRDQRNIPLDHYAA